ncbi:MAG: response regulator [Ardenticatenales bacterium]|nr:response regulator [Ardenticatenales bacterium]
MVKSILVVDDEPEVREVVGMVLSTLGGYKVAYAEDGLVALQKLATFKPDLIVLDMMMLNMDGLSFMIELEQRGWCIPTLVLTAHVAAYDTAVKRLGTGCCMMKPFEVNDLLKRVQTVLRLAPVLLPPATTTPPISL